MGRIKPAVKRIESLEEANLVLKEIGLLEGELEAVDSGANKQIAGIKSAAAIEGGPRRKRIAELSGLLGAYAEYNRAELFNEDKKSVQLSFGVFGYRKSTKISVKKTTLGLLKKLKMSGFVRTKEEPDKKAMAKLDDDALRQVDAVRKVKDEFFLEANKEEINKDLLKERRGMNGNKNRWGIRLKDWDEPACAAGTFYQRPGTQR
jgi:phage host-nuclease inhibitor protein Gam